MKDTVKRSYVKALKSRAKKTDEKLRVARHFLTLISDIKESNEAVNAAKYNAREALRLTS